MSTIPVLKGVKLSYTDNNGKYVEFKLEDWDAVYNLAQKLVNSPVDIEYLNYEDGTRVGTFNLKTFERN